ncbi:hypothetical protein ACIJYE_04740 [Candidatus Pelagibacter bacterium nBUS_30]|uniref:hypothetical protein n=1 Tax=Candidatus Pelagibacter bacterium nBUS_30 TaxID=3374191 RepID=UPI003EB9E77A
MKLNFKYYFFKKLYIHFCILALVNIFFSTDIIHAKTFSIEDIEISTPFEINFDKNEIIDKSFTKAFTQLILSIVQIENQKKLNKTSLGEIKSMIETFSIKEEKFVDEIYYLTLNVSFNKKKIFNFLESKNIFPSLPIKKNILFIPIIVDEEKNEILMFSESNLFNRWNLNIKKYHLLNYVLPAEDLDDFDLIKANSKNLENYDFKEIIKKYNLSDYIITIIFKNNKEIRVLNKINFNEKEDLKNLRFEKIAFNDDNNVEQFTENLKSIFENYWKSKNEINTSVKLSLTISIDNHDNTKVSKFEETLSDVDLVYDFSIFKFNNKSNIYKIIFNGSPDYFIKIMKNKNYEFDTQNQTWSIK